MTNKTLDLRALEAAYASVPDDKRDKNLIATVIRSYLDATPCDWADEYIDALNLVCEIHGCPPGSDRLVWLDLKLS